MQKRHLLCNGHNRCLFLLYRKYRVTVKREGDDSYRVKKPCRAGGAPRGEEVSCKQYRSGAENPAGGLFVLAEN